MGSAETVETDTTKSGLGAWRRVMVVRTNLEGVEATFSSVEGCIQTDVFLMASIDATRMIPEPTLHDMLATIVISQFDVCTGEVLISGAEGTTEFEFFVADDLSSASLQATIPFGNAATGELLSIDVEATWTATGPIVRNRGITIDNSIEGVRIISLFRERTRAADSEATALVTINSTEQNLTPETSIDGRIFDSRNGVVTISMRQ